MTRSRDGRASARRARRSRRCASLRSGSAAFPLKVGEHPADTATVNVAFAAVVFAPALAIGSFLNVVASRLPAGRSLVRPRSACPHCDEPIRSRDNIPVLSYLAAARPLPLLQARRSAGAIRRSSSRRRSSSSACFVALGPDAAGARRGDLLRRARRRSRPPTSSCVIVPNRVVLPGGGRRARPAAGLASEPRVAARRRSAPRSSSSSSRSPTRAGLGMGDVKLALLLGVGVGRSVPVALMVGMVAALVPSAVLFARHGAAARKLAIPFAPFLAARRDRGAVCRWRDRHELVPASSSRRPPRRGLQESRARADTSFEGHGRVGLDRR